MNIFYFVKEAPILRRHEEQRNTRNRWNVGVDWAHWCWEKQKEWGSKRQFLRDAVMQNSNSYLRKGQPVSKVQKTGNSQR
jgi:hypothetical protein